MKNQENKMAFLALGTFVLMVLLYKIGFVLMPFMLSFILAHFLHPLANYFAKKGVSRSLTSLLIVVLFFAFLTGFVMLVVPFLYNQSSQMASAIPSYIEICKNEVYPKYVEFLNSSGFGVALDFDDVLDSTQILGFAKNFSSKIFASTASAINVLSLIFIMPILIFYLLRDWQKVIENIKSYLSVDSEKKFSTIVADVDLALSGYVRGQLFVCLIMALIYAILLSLTGLNFAFLIGVLTGLLSFIPYIGAVTGFLAAILIALFQWGFSFVDISMVILAFIAGQIIESNFLTPKLIGEKIGLHPVWVIFGIFVFGSLFGFFGVVFATPLVAVFGVFVKHLAREYKKRFI